MPRNARAALAAVSLFLSAPLVSALQSPGEVLWNKKISAMSGGGPKGIQSFDQFGRGSCVIGDLDGDGVVDLAVGAPGDDDVSLRNTTEDYGCVWILFLKPDGTVKSSKRISKTSAGLPLDLGDEFGRTVRELGDFDLDGVPDLVAGANYDDDNGTDKGAFYLLFLNRDGSVKSWKKISEIAGGFTGDLDPDDQFGRGLRCLGDLDLDGVPDIGVGAIRDDDGGKNRGCYWILFMKRDGTVKSHAKLSETAGNFQSTLSDYGEFGFDCAVLGDRNGDGIQDIAISAPDQKTDSLQQGAVFIVFLNRNGTAKSDFRIAENYAGFNGNMLDYNDEFGCCIDTVGDLDNDGNIDLAVGAGKDDDGLSGSVDKGALYILFLDPGCNVKSWQKISSLFGRFDAQLDSQDRFGTSLAFPGDLNGDGIEDLFVGARFDDDGGSGVGAEYFLALNDGRFTPPSADFTATPRRGPAPLPVQFSDQSTGDLTSWRYDFGDGGTSTEQNPQHTYLVPNTYSVTLNVTGPAGKSSITFVTVIKVDPPLPPATSFAATPTSGQEPLGVQFTDQSGGLVSGWSWDFGDGFGANSPNPAHTYSSAGSFSVTLAVAGPGGTDLETKVGLVSVVLPPPPVAEFLASPLNGSAPLAVSFADLSGGAVSAWAWDFGDGTGSSARNPSHVYAQPGTYSVSLLASGPGGADAEVKLDLVSVSALRRGLADPSFEEGSAGTLPAGPWVSFFGVEHRIEPVGPAASDGTLPTHGLHWLRVSAAGTDAAVPPASPGGPTLPPLGSAGVRQSFYLAEALHQLVFDGAFVRNGAASNPLANDWMSVDVSDGITTVNLFYADTFTSTPNTSAALGLPMTAVTKVSANLRALFPGSLSDALFTLTIQVGNGGDGMNPSCGLVDNLRLEQAQGTALRYGCGINPEKSLTLVSGTPRLGATLVFGITNPLGTQGRSSSTLYMSLKPDVNYPCGTLAPGLGMSGAGQPGEWLVNRVAPDPIKKVAGSVWTVPGSPALVTLVVPASASWIGTPLYVQGFLLDPAATYGVRTGLTDALKLLIAP